MATDEAQMKLLQPEAGEEVPPVYRSLNFRSLQDPYSHGAGDTMASRYSTLRADDLDTMLNGGLERFYKKYDHLSRKINLQLPTPEVRFESLSFSVQVPAEAGAYGTVGSHLGSVFTPWQKIPTTTKHALHPMSGIIKPGSMTLILANPGAGKSTFLKALAGKLQDNKQTDIGGQVLYSGLKGEDIDLIKLTGLVDQTDNHIPTLTVRETFKFADIPTTPDACGAALDANQSLHRARVEVLAAASPDPRCSLLSAALQGLAPLWDTVVVHPEVGKAGTSPT
ncbi:ATP-binding Cassette (ABC) Superfamily [Phytophthora cinnamomi]|uniref:ATP-binding Cassette (ABC) Superfamily n=1 Tax=Phytophthora cinnamomi TaxID=4785 RepID=UPI00355AB4E3|nr:ATP-binding Cassette (ABC) Superfamily [Phytophthora cinnamomi]